MNLRTFFTAAIILVTVGCDGNRPGSNDPAKTKSQAKSSSVAEEATIGNVTKDGNLVIHVFNSVDTPPVPLPVELKDNYGFMIFNNGSLDEPKLKVVIASKPDMKLSEATKWEDVEIIVSKIPARSGIRYFGKCTCPTFYGLPDDTWDRFMALVQKYNLTYDEGQDQITCTCFRNGG